MGTLDCAGYRAPERGGGTVFRKGRLGAVAVAADDLAFYRWDTCVAQTDRGNTTRRALPGSSSLAVPPIHEKWFAGGE